MVDSAPVVQTDKDAIAYLTKYGYATQPCVGSNTACMLRQHSSKSMIEDYQRKFKLAVTGKLDFATKQLMNQPRCGNSDRKLPSSLLVQRLQGNRIWEHRRVTWSFRKEEPTYAHWTEQAFRKWKEILPQFDFIQVCATCPADIKLSFEKGNHGDGEQFAFSSDTLAHAYYPKDGTIHFNYDQAWRHNFVKEDKSYNFYLTAVHEIGHALGYMHNGLPHNFNDETSVMYPMYKNLDKNDLFQETDKQAMKTIYPRDNNGDGIKGRGTIITYPNGDRYEGTQKDGKKHGYGTLFLVSGEKYVGNWADDKRNGQGVRILPSGNRYEGAWKDDMRHGYGTLLLANKDKYIGNWADDKKSGQGVNTWSDGARYEGAWKNGMRHGYGTLLLANGEKYVGDWVHAKKKGQGVNTWPNGNRYKGAFKDGKMHGRGKFTFKNGKVQQGNWSNDTFIGF